MKPLIVANWKNHPASWSDAKKLFDATKKAFEKTKNLSLIIAPPAVYLRELSKSRSKRLSFAAQGVVADEVGAHTGETTLSQVKDARATYVLVGHAERRERGESNDDTAQIIPEAFLKNITPILCVGERTRQDDGEHFHFIREQLRVGFSNVPAGKISKVIVAYEPVWAIGGTAAMKPRDMHEMAIFIRKSIYDLHGKVGLTQTVLYGGSIDEKSAGQMLGLGDVQGLLIGRASTNAEQFTALISSLANIK